MKKINILSVSIILTLLISSCGSLSISQKRYSRGLNIDWFSKKDDVAGPVKKAKKKEKPVIAITDEKDKAIVNNDLEVNSEVIQESVAGMSPNETESVDAVEETPVSKKSSLFKRHENVENKQQASTSKRHLKPVLKNIVKGIDKSSDADANMILLIILAFILPPLAIYLYFGEIEIHFWINILLIVLAGGVWGGVGFFGLGLAWIHALLVIFGVFG